MSLESPLSKQGFVGKAETRHSPRYCTNNNKETTTPLLLTKERMVRNSTKRAAASASTPVAARLSPATATTPSPMAATTATTTRGRQPPRTSTSSAVTDPSTSPRPQRTTRASASSSTPAAVVPVEAQAPVIQLKDENDGSKSFTCSTCQVKVKLDANRSPSEHTCETKPEIRLRKRLRGPPPYQYSNEEAAVALPPIKKRGKKAAFVSLHEKKAVDAEKEAWLQREVLNKVYDPKDIWCRYCGCVQASGFSRGPWVSSN